MQHNAISSCDGWEIVGICSSGKQSQQTADFARPYPLFQANPRCFNGGFSKSMPHDGEGAPTQHCAVLRYPKKLGRGFENEHPTKLAKSNPFEAPMITRSWYPNKLATIIRVSQQ